MQRRGKIYLLVKPPKFLSTYENPEIYINKYENLENYVRLST
jgi:hypothetical protein